MKFIWAFDPNQNPKDAIKLIKEIKFWARTLKATVQPVCVLSDSLLDIPDKMLKNKDYRKASEHLVTKYITHTSAKSFLPVRILRVSSDSRRKKALALSAYAADTNADLIFLNTHVKNSWNPLEMGGFAEALITLSKTSLVVLNPTVAPSISLTNIFFPTDFERPSKKSLEVITPWALGFKSKVTLFNRIATTAFYMSNISGPPPVVTAIDLIDEMYEIRKKQARKWKERLTKHHLEVTSLIQQQKYSLARDIVSAAKRNNADLIALVNKPQPVAERFLGSTARNVMVRAHCPVLILR